MFDSSIFSLILSKKSCSFAQIVSKKLPATGRAEIDPATSINQNPFILVSNNNSCCCLVRCGCGVIYVLDCGCSLVVRVGGSGDYPLARKLIPLSRAEDSVIVVYVGTLRQ